MGNLYFLLNFSNKLKTSLKQSETKKTNAEEMQDDDHLHIITFGVNFVFSPMKP